MSLTRVRDLVKRIGSVTIYDWVKATETAMEKGAYTLLETKEQPYFKIKQITKENADEMLNKIFLNWNKLERMIADHALLLDYTDQKEASKIKEASSHISGLQEYILRKIGKTDNRLDVMNKNRFSIPQCRKAYKELYYIDIIDCLKQIKLRKKKSKRGEDLDF